jgi:hypothetical protein
VTALRHYLIKRSPAVRTPKGVAVIASETVTVLCPYCGERVELLVDATLPHQQYVEDCEVCCRPMLVTIDATAEEPIVDVTRENE